jgi:hypothetical protein
MAKKMVMLAAAGIWKNLFSRKNPMIIKTKNAIKTAITAAK